MVRQKVILRLASLLCTVTGISLLLTLIIITPVKEASAAALGVNGSKLISLPVFVNQNLLPNPIQRGTSATSTLQVINDNNWTLPVMITHTLVNALTPNREKQWTVLIDPGFAWQQSMVVTPVLGASDSVSSQLAVTFPTTWSDSYFTSCAEEDNINVLLYGPDVMQYRITATHPDYAFATDNCNADFSGCSYS